MWDYYRLQAAFRGQRDYTCITKPVNMIILDYWVSAERYWANFRFSAEPDSYHTESSVVIEKCGRTFLVTDFSINVLPLGPRMPSANNVRRMVIRFRLQSLGTGYFFQCLVYSALQERFAKNVKAGCHLPAFTMQVDDPVKSICSNQLGVYGLILLTVLYQVTTANWTVQLLVFGTDYIQNRCFSQTRLAVTQQLYQPPYWMLKRVFQYQKAHAGSCSYHSPKLVV